MTSKKVPRVCDFCANDIVSEMKYKLQISQRGSPVKGEFIKANNDADMCQECFLKICKNGYAPNWITLKKNEQTSKWEEIDPQKKIG